MESRALLALLGDDDTRTVALVKEQLMLGGKASIPALEALKRSARYPATRHIDSVIAQIRADEAREALQLLCRCYPEESGLKGLEQAVFLLSEAVQPGCDVVHTRAQLDRWGEELSALLNGAATAAERIAVITRFFGFTLNLRGNSDNYYALKNSLLPEVIRTRLGIPLSLALVYLFVGRRAGIDIAGVSFPGHFLVRVEGAFLDPFENARVLTPADCADILLRQKLRVEVAYFEAAACGQIFRRLLANLLYVSQSDHKALVPLLEGWIGQVDQHAPERKKPSL